MPLRKPIQILIEAKDKTAAAFRSVNRQLEAAAGRVQDIGKRLGLAFGVFAGGGITANIKRTADELDRLAKVASKIGTTTEELSKLRFAAEQTGVSANTLDTALQRMVRRVGEAAQGTGEAANALQELGLDAQQLAAMAPEEQFKLIADAMGDIPTQTDKVRLAFKLFDSEGVALVNTLAGGSEALNNFGRELESLGGVIDSEAAAAAEKFNDDLKKMQIQFDALSVALGSKLIPNWTAWLELVQGGDINRIGAGGLVSKEIEEVNTQIVNLKSRIAELQAGPSIGDAISARGVSLEQLAQQNDRDIQVLLEQLEELQDKRADLLDSEVEKRALARREAAERQHNREMASAREDQNKELKAALDTRAKLLQEHVTNTQRFAQQQQQLTNQINGLLADIGTSDQPVERIDVLRKSVEAWDQLGQGNFAQVLQLVKEGLGLLGEYEGTGDASAASIIGLKESFKQLAEQAGKAQKADLERSLEFGQEQLAKLKEEIAEKPAAMVIVPDTSSGKNIHTGVQGLLKQEGPVVVDVALNLTGINPGRTVTDSEAGITVTELEDQSDKRGHRI